MLAFNYRRLLLVLIGILLLGFDFYQNFINQTDGDLSRVLTEIDEIRLADFKIHGILLPYYLLIHKLYWIIFDVVSFCTDDPVDSIYITIALFKSTYVPLLFLTMLNLLKLRANFLDLNLNLKLIILCIILIYNQNFGFNRSLGIVNHSFIYFCSYALAVSLLFYSITVYLVKKSVTSVIFVFVFGLFGSLNPIIPMGLVICAFLVLFIKGENIWHLVRKHKFFLLVSLILVLLKIGSAVYLEVENITCRALMPLIQRYNLLFSEGLDNFFLSMGFFVLFFYVLIQFFLRNRCKSELPRQEFLFLVIFFIGYISVLPLFGYKPYRPYIIKSDIMTPCLMLLHLLIIFFMITGYSQENLKMRGLLINGTSIILLIVFGYKDRVVSNSTMNRERYLLDSISEKSYKTISEHTCFSISEPIMFWKGMEKNKALIDRNIIFLRRCGVLKEGHSYCLVE